MRRLGVLLGLLLLLTACDSGDISGCLSGCLQVNGGGPTIKGSGTAKTETRAVTGFTAVHVSVGADVAIERTGSDSLTVTADDNLLPLFTSEVKDGTLDLSVVKGKSLAGKMPVYKLTVADLKDVSIRGSGEVTATKLDSASLSLSIAGSGDGKLAGRADALSISISGSGSADAAALTAKRAKVVISGSGDVTVNASDELDATIAGSGSVRYLGSPKVTSHIAGSGSVEQKAK